LTAKRRGYTGRVICDNSPHRLRAHLRPLANRSFDGYRPVSVDDAPMPQPPPDGLPVYRLLSGADDDAFCRRVSESARTWLPAVRQPGRRERPRPSHSRAGSAVACPIAAINRRGGQSTMAWQPLGRNGRSLTADGSILRRTQEADSALACRALRSREVSVAEQAVPPLRA
jgi:hypothetical protein